MPDKVNLSLLPPNPTVEQILTLFRNLTGREPTQDEVDELKAKAVMGGPAQAVARITPDAEEANADWPKRTKDVTLSGQ